MKKHWKLVVVIALLIGAGYFIFCLAYDAYEERCRGLPQERQRARLDRLNKDTDAFARNAGEHTPSGAEMIFWEYQSWKTGGGRNRLTLWADGRSEARVYPCRHRPTVALRPEGEWKKEEKDNAVCFVRNPAYSKTDAKEKFRSAFKLGIHLLKPVKQDYVDGSGVLIGIRTNGLLKEQVYPMFGLEYRETENYIRFEALSRILGEFDLEPKAFRVVPKK